MLLSTILNGPGQPKNIFIFFIFYISLKFPVQVFVNSEASSWEPVKVGYSQNQVRSPVLVSLIKSRQSEGLGLTGTTKCADARNGMKKQKQVWFVMYLKPSPAAL